MTIADRSGGVPTTDVFKALGDPIRWEIIRLMAETDELPASTLESSLPVSRPTISYHAKILVQAGLISVRKEGRNYYYTLRREVLERLMDDVWAIAPRPAPVRAGRIDHSARPRRRTGSAAERPAGTASDAMILTW